MDVPRAPGLGLLLEQVHYHNYDRHYSNIHPTLDTFELEIEEKIKKIREELIIKEILETEVTTNQMMLWLGDLVKHDFQIEPESDSASGPHGIALARATALSAEGEDIRKVNEDEDIDDQIEEDNEEVIEKKAAVA